MQIESKSNFMGRVLFFEMQKVPKIILTVIVTTVNAIKTTELYTFKKCTIYMTHELYSQ